MAFLYGLIAVVALVLLTALVCFLLTFYNPRRDPKTMAEKRLPPGRIYKPYHGDMNRWYDEMMAMKREPLSVTTPDRLTLRGHYYELTPDSPLEILFHGYRGFSERDMSGAVQRCFAVGHSALLVDQRGHGISDGHVITFGLRESRDVALWAELAAQRFGPDRPVVIGGVSMGAATVLMAAGQDLPPNVVGVLADCGYSSAPAIIQKVMRERGLPVWLMYPFVRLGALLFGRFDPNRADAVAAMKRCRLPVLFFHGDTDAYVPWEMSRENYDACAAPKRLVITPGAGHGLCFPADRDTYVAAVKEFDEKYWHPEKTEEN